MSLQKNSQRRLQSSTRVELARDLHDSLAQDLVAIGFQLDLLTEDLPYKYRASAREIRLRVTEATKRVRRELFALREIDSAYQQKLLESAGSLGVEVVGDLSTLAPSTRKLVTELVRNSALHSKGRLVRIEIKEKSILVSDDGQGLFGVGQLLDETGGTLEIRTSHLGTEVEITLP